MGLMDCLRKTGKSSRMCSYLLAWIFLLLVILAFIFLLLINVLGPHHVDSRCKCVCPHNLNTTDYYNTTVFQKLVQDPSSCSCEEVLPEHNHDETVCLRCSCSFESRNNILIGMIVIGLIVIISCLCLYTVFVCLQPLFWKNRLERGFNYSSLREDSMYYDLQISMQQIRWRQRVAHERTTERLT